MKLIKFSVTNYKVFKEEFTIDISKDSIAILTGRNNTGKSTILEAINCFFQKETKAKTIQNDCFSIPSSQIVLEAIFENSDEETITIRKKYTSEAAPIFYDDKDLEIKNRHQLVPILDKILSNKPFYITPSMLPDDINELIQDIYSDIIKNDLSKLEENNNEEVDKETRILADEYAKLKTSYPEFVRKIKQKTDNILSQVSHSVSNDLKILFSNETLSLKVIGGESTGFSSSDLLKSTNSVIHIDNNKQVNMPLANQGTGLQRMSLIYLIQNMIEKRLLDENDDKLLLIDEPEAFLHPEAVRALSRSLYKIGKKMPLMISTHSPILIDLSERHTSIQVFRVSEKAAIELYKSANDQFDSDDIANMKILNYVDSYVNEFFFADRIVIVEGDTEYIAFKHLAREKDLNIHIIRARGKATIATIMKILNQFNTSYDILHDADNHNKFGATTLKAQLTNCKKLANLKTNSSIRIFCSISHFEKAIGEEDVQNSKKTTVIHNIINEATTNETRVKVENIFDQIINREEMLPFLGTFKRIEKAEDYDELFDDLIKTKSSQEPDKKEKGI